MELSTQHTDDPFSLRGIHLVSMESSQFVYRLISLSAISFSLLQHAHAAIVADSVDEL